MSNLIVEGVIDELDAIVAADGGRLWLRDASESSVELELDLSSSACPECVLPKEMLVQIVQARLATVAPDVREVHLHDPRELDAPATS